MQQVQFAPYDLDSYLPRQIFKGRSGKIIVSLNPYTSIDTHHKGSSHATQYANNTHVPLIFYQKDRFENQKIIKNVCMPQVAVTLATLLEVPRPSAATGSLLPGITLQKGEVHEK